MGTPATIPVVWSNDDISHSQSPQLQRQLDFIDDLGIPGSFFIVPKNGNGPIDEDPELLATIASARQSGHTFHQHGYQHDAFECGVPETWMLDFSPPTRERYDLERLEIEKRHTYEAQLRMLEAGRRIWRRAFGEEPIGFRPGWGAMCRAHYRALETLGYGWTSSRLICKTSWLWNQGMWEAPMEFREGLSWTIEPIADTSVLEIPMTGGDYGFRVHNELDKIQAMAELGMREFEFCHERGLPFVFVSHWHGLQHGEDAGYAVHKLFIEALQASGKAEFMTMTALYERHCAAAG